MVSPKCGTPDRNSERDASDRNLLRTAIVGCLLSALRAESCGCDRCRVAKYLPTVQSILLTLVVYSMDDPRIDETLFRDVLRAVESKVNEFIKNNPGVKIEPFPELSPL